MDTYSIVKELVEISFTVYNLIELHKGNRKTAKDLYTCIVDMQKRIKGYYDVTGLSLEQSVAKDIFATIVRDLGKVNAELKELTAHFQSRKLHKKVKLILKASDIDKMLSSLVSTVSDINIRLENCGMSIVQLSLLKWTAEKLNGLTAISQEIRNNQRAIDPVTNQQAGVLIDLIETFNSKLNIDDITRIDDESTRAEKNFTLKKSEGASSSSSNDDAKEDREMNLLLQLPNAARHLLAKITKPGDNTNSTKELMRQITEIWTGWQIDWRNISFVKDEYNKDAELGRGRSATVYDAMLKTARGLETSVAVKSVPFNKKNVCNVLREVFLHLMLQHHAIVQLYGMFYPEKGKGNALIVVERMECSLEDALTDEMEFDAVNVLRDIAGAIAHMHDHDVIHRDVKPGNILLTANGKVAKLSDFGSSRRQVENSLTLQSMALGTLMYMPPEVEPRTQTKTRRSWDVWSFGIVICEVLSNDGVDTFIKLQTADAASAAQTWAGSIEDHHMRAVAMWCVQANPQDRPPMRKVYLHLNGTLPIDEIPIVNNSSMDIDTVVPRKHDGQHSDRSTEEFVNPERTTSPQATPVTETRSDQDEIIATNIDSTTTEKSVGNPPYNSNSTVADKETESLNTSASNDNPSRTEAHQSSPLLNGQSHMVEGRGWHSFPKKNDHLESSVEVEIVNESKEEMIVYQLLSDGCLSEKWAMGVEEEDRFRANLKFGTLLVVIEKRTGIVRTVAAVGKPYCKLTISSNGFEFRSLGYNNNIGKGFMWPLKSVPLDQQVILKIWNNVWGGFTISKIDEEGREERFVGELQFRQTWDGIVNAGTILIVRASYFNSAVFIPQVEHFSLRLHY